MSVRDPARDPGELRDVAVEFSYLLPPSVPALPWRSYVFFVVIRYRYARHGFSPFFPVSGIMTGERRNGFRQARLLCGRRHGLPGSRCGRMGPCGWSRPVIRRRGFCSATWSGSRSNARGLTGWQPRGGGRIAPPARAVLPHGPRCGLRSTRFPGRHLHRLRPQGASPMLRRRSPTA